MLCWGLFQRIASSVLRGSGPEGRYSTARGQRADTPLSLIGESLSSVRSSVIPKLGPLLRTLTRYSECGQPRPRAEQAAHVRNSGFTCGTRWNPGHCRTQPIHDGSWGSHTQARDAAFTGTRQTRPPTTATFPRRTADKSPPQQHDVSSLQVGLNQLKHQLFPTNKPKSHPFSNT